jgi:antagonist of KipI
MKALSILRPGMLTTVQDLGRWGHQHEGVPVAGPMDWYSHSVANRLVGNPDGAAALEVTLLGPELTANADILCAVAGAIFELSCEGQPVPQGAPFTVSRGARLRFGARSAGARATLAVAGGLDVDAVLGSRATSLISRMGPLAGRPVAAGDTLPIGSLHRPDRRSPRRLPLPREGTRLRVMLGPHADWFTEDAIAALRRGRYFVTQESNRMGYRLDGAVLARAQTTDMLSDATPMGSLQVPPSGLPILLMADRQTTGGYPKIATVITADLPLAGQLAPGDWIEFVPCSRAMAIDALRARVAALDGSDR